MINESQVRELLEAADDDTALVLLEGRARVLDPAELRSDEHRGAAVLLTRGDLVERLGTSSPAEHDLKALSATLRTMAAELGA
ncbi:hypothetical protein [Streptomyces sp. NPDC050856]|uniref:hypothetical protein n=1 Tax=Streptomyces sp. NPDC050856 TaxID=3154939 RepID=UPI0033EE0733